MKPALVITTYNQSRALRFCLQALTMQTHRDFDVYIADDGSTDDTRSVIESYREYFKVFVHTTHEHTGRDTKAKICNTVFRKLKNYPFVTCIDGDTIAHREFIADHVRFHTENPGELLFMGRRVDMGPGISNSLDEAGVRELAMGRYGGLSIALIKSALTGDSPTGLRAFRITSPLIQKLLKRDQVHDLLGSNFSVTTSALFRVNGYNESIEGYWGEDGDLFIRLRNAGVKCIGLKSMAIQFHLWHERRPVTPEKAQAYSRAVLDTTTVRCARGIETA